MVDSGTGGGAITGATTYLRLGATCSIPATPSSFYNGVLDDFRIYDEALSEAEIEAIMDASPASNLVGWWKFDDDSGGIAVDSSGNGYDGTIIGATLVSGANDGAFDFDGINDYVTIPSSVFSTVDDEVSFAMWQNGGANCDNGVRNYLFSGEKSGETTLFAGHMLSGSLKVQLNAGTIDYINVLPGSQYEYKGQWNHWVYTKKVSAGEMKIYQNGDLYLSSGGKGGAITGLVAFNIGARVGGSEYFYDGMLDDFRIYNKVLSEAEIEALATVTEYTILGSVGSLDGVTMSGLPGDVVTSGGGSYSVTVASGWDGTVTPVMTGYTFSPASKTYSDVTSNQTSQDYTPSVVTYTISGDIGSLENVELYGLPS